ncbi:fimbrillin family protein [Parabacteroides sp. PF5-6]|uniref:fimbrillin family protein n=1 Tax=Parabacteroides sp. PF5-6 TaxID=1742403 RepID=UPI002405066C|nr:fimbrillin family protein [Parabacteroides sp. PF5-6]MDF9829915.1 hypothetical protein [Parabacteroides sp. PF5-6]
MKKFLLFAFSVCLLSACSSGSEDIGSDIPKEDPPVAITLSAKSLTIDVKTKAPYTETTPTEAAPLKAWVISSLASGDYLGRHSIGTMTFEGVTATKETGETPYDSGAENPYYPADETIPLYFIGLYPTAATEGDPDWTFSAEKSEASFTFDGKADVMHAGEVSKSKGEYLAEDGKAPALAFAHQLTLLHVYLKAENENAQAAWGEITGIELVKAGDAAASNTITISTGTVEVEGGEEGEETYAAEITFSSVPAKDTPIPFYIAEEETEVDESISVIYSDGVFPKVNAETGAAYTLSYEATPLAAYAMVEAITADGTLDYTLKIKSKKYEAGREVGISLKRLDSDTFTGSTQGKSFNITLTFGTTEIKATATVTGWEESGSAEETVK